MQLRGEAATERFGAALSTVLELGDVVGLEGRLGAGKTRLAGAIIAGLGWPPDQPVTSPTFALVQHYEARVPVVHADLYRIDDTDQVWALGLHESQPSSITIVEWGKKHAAALDAALWVTLGITDDTTRSVTLEPSGPRGEAIVAQLSAFEG